MAGRTPHGVRGLKSKSDLHPSNAHRRTPHGVRGLKWYYQCQEQGGGNRRTPHGVRGLKLQSKMQLAGTGVSHPTRGAWIEIWSKLIARFPGKVAPHTGCVD